MYRHTPTYSNVSIAYMHIIHWFVIGFDGCPFGTDLQWEIIWPNTPRNTINVQRCPGGFEVTGMLNELE